MLTFLAAIPAIPLLHMAPSQSLHHHILLSPHMATIPSLLLQLTPTLANISRSALFHSRLHPHMEITTLKSLAASPFPCLFKWIPASTNSQQSNYLVLFCRFRRTKSPLPSWARAHPIIQPWQPFFHSIQVFFSFSFLQLHNQSSNLIIFFCFAGLEAAHPPSNPSMPRSPIPASFLLSPPWASVLIKSTKAVSLCTHELTGADTVQ